MGELWRFHDMGLNDCDEFYHGEFTVAETAADTHPIKPIDLRMIEVHYDQPIII